MADTDNFAAFDENHDSNGTMQDALNMQQSEIPDPTKPFTYLEDPYFINNDIPYIHNYDDMRQFDADVAENEISSPRYTRDERIRKDIMELQLYLRELSFEYPEIPRITIDGFYNEQTVDAMKAFQRLAGLEPTGLVDHDTWDALVISYYKSVRKNSQPRAIQPFPHGDYVAKPGEASSLIYHLQLLLKFFGQVFSNLGEQMITGVLDDATINNIKNFQKIAGLPVTGTVDRSTWDALALAYNSLLHPTFRPNSQPVFMP